MDWRSRQVLVTGGASFIGSHLVDALVERGATVRVVDNLSSGASRTSASTSRRAGRVLRGDLLDQETARARSKGIDVVFHLAADHGGRGYVDLHQVACATNLTLDGLVFARVPQGRRREGRLRLVGLRLSEPPPDGSERDPLPDRGHGRATVRRGQPVRLGQADGRDDAARVLHGDGHEGGVLPLLHRLRRPRPREPRRDRDDRARVRPAGSVRGLGHRRADPQLDARERHRQRHDRGGGAASTTARR